MTTKKLVFVLFMFALVSMFLMFFIPFALNANNTLTNAGGVAVIVVMLIGVVVAFHKKFTQTKEN